MSEKTYTERELVLAQRESFAAGSAWRWADTHPVADERVNDRERAVAERRYPLPRVTRPRMLPDPHVEFDQFWRCVDGVIQWAPNEHCRGERFWHALGEQSDLTFKAPGATVALIHDVTIARIKLWADLLNNPTETVNDDGSVTTPAGRRTEGGE